MTRSCNKSHRRIPHPYLDVSFLRSDQSLQKIFFPYAYVAYYVHTIHFHRVSPRGFLIGRPPQIDLFTFSAPCRFNELRLNKKANVRKANKIEKELNTHGRFLRIITGVNKKRHTKERRKKRIKKIKKKSNKSRNTNQRIKK